MIEERIDELIKAYNDKIDKCREDRKNYKFALIADVNENQIDLIERYARCIACCDNEIKTYASFIKSLEYAKTGERKMNNKELKKNLEKERKKQREDAIKINTFIRLDKSSASEIDKQIEETYLSLQKNIKFVCTNKDLMNSMLDELDYIVYASKLYGGKHVMEELDNRYRNKLMS